ncbi:hypothetical protein [Candidatus Nitrosocosmicus franklandus]|uniref:Uncharacterized protein n=1 Tax=Candidatus Nitrosocosmicus franklandianus TaxID=1798806 RepID=A0A484I7Z2_9ARCH|nr:hypothetical protein [Candidatus Nitrosocosmicus franklandus]VFJ12402.1 protein of unknown function [Candidatus Nitrosocosmicus franklandus]
MTSSEFFDIDSPLGGSVIEDKASIYLDEDIPLCDDCKNIVLQPYLDNKLFCTKCKGAYDLIMELSRSRIPKQQ